MERPSESLMAEARRESLQLAKLLGYSTNPTLPLLDVTTFTRSPSEVAARALVLHACCAVSYGFSLVLARAWLTKNELMDHASPEERRFLSGGSSGEPFKLRPEAIWAFSWVLEKTDTFAVHLPMPQDAVAALPNLKKGEGADAWISSSGVRDSVTVLKALDFYYCAHWALRDAGSHSRAEPTTLPAYAVVERRRALEWCFGSDDWDYVSLDT